MMLGRRRISPDLKLVICRLYTDGILTLEDVTSFAFSYTTLWRCLAELRQRGMIRRQGHSSGRRRVLAPLDAHLIDHELQHNPAVYLDEVQSHLRRHAANVSLSTISRHLNRNQLTKRKLMRIAWERQDEKVCDYLYRVSAFSPRQLVFLDESSFDARTTSRLGGRGAQGNRHVSLRVWRNYHPRYSLVAGLHLTNDPSKSAIMAPRVVTGSVTGAIFREWIHELLSGCRTFPGEDSVVVMDNASIHRRAVPIIEDHGCVVVFLPPYSPQFNPIEQAFGQIKATLRRHDHPHVSSNSTLLVYNVLTACDSVCGSHAHGYYQQDGYLPHS